MKREKFTKEQLQVIDNTELLNGVYSSLLELSANEDYSLNRKRCLMFRELVNYMRIRKGQFLMVGIKNNVADKLIKNEIKTLELTTRELKNAVLQDN